MGATITGAFVEWDDAGQAFRVYLTREVDVDAADEDIDIDDEAQPMRAVHDMGDDPSGEARLYRAAMMKCAKDFTDIDAIDAAKALGWPRRPQAERVCKAVVREIGAMKAGKPPPSVEDVRLALVMAGGRVR